MKSQLRSVLIRLGYAVAIGSVLAVAGFAANRNGESPTLQQSKASDSAEDLRAAVDRFIRAADKLDITTVAATYDPAFANFRVADEGGVAHITRDQMLEFLKAAKERSGGHSLPTKDTKIHHAEVVGDTG